jgi:hypothetical protein
MRKRDKAIIDDLNKFRCMSRDQIVTLHFNNVKHPIKNANDVLKRLRLYGYIEANTERQPYVYFPVPSVMKRESAKLDHYLAIADVYIDMCAYEQPREFIVEPRYGADYMQPDAFAIWKGTPFFIELQRTVYSENTMKAKFDRYKRYFASEEWREETWQPQKKKVFPCVLVISPTRYGIAAGNIRVFQAPDIKTFVQSLK